MKNLKKQLLKVLNNLINSFKKEIVLDGDDLMPKGRYKSKTYINSEGKLMYQNLKITGQITGISEWPNVIKKMYGINKKNVKVIDFVIIPNTTEELC